MRVTQDLISQGTLRQILFWIQLGGVDIASRYRRSVLGPFWILLVNSITIIAIGVVYSSLFGMQLDTYFPFLVVGYIFWLWISGLMVEMTSAFSAYRYILINNAVTPMAVLARVFARNLLIFIHNLPVILIVLVFYGPHYSWQVLLVIPNFLLIAATLFAGTGALAFLAARYQDMQHLITASIGVFFLVTPIIWSPDVLTERAYIASINPLSHVMELLRTPLLGGMPNTVNYVVCLGLFVVCAIAFMQSYMRCHTRYIFWI